MDTEMIKESVVLGLIFMWSHCINLWNLSFRWLYAWAYKTGESFTITFNF